MNVNALLDLQNELLKPFAPSQEYALLTLIAPNMEYDIVVEFCSEIQDRFPHVIPLHEAFADKRPANAIPLIVPVAQMQTARQELFTSDNGTVSLSADFRLLLSLFVSRVPEHVSSPDELYYGADDCTVRITLEELTTAIMHGFYSGVSPLVSETRNYGAGIRGVLRSLFPTAA